MKRPGWLGGKDDSGEEPGDEELPEERGKKKQDESAAERSARRKAAREERGAGASSVARRKLADRVGKAGGEPKQKDPEKPEAAKKPDEAKGPERPERRRETAAKRKSADAKETGKAKAGEPAEETAEPAKKLNRPRRQPGPATSGAKRRREPEGEEPERGRSAGDGDERKPAREEDGKPEPLRGKRDKRDRDRGERSGAREDEGRRRRERGDGERKRGRAERPPAGKRARADRPSAGKRARAGAAGFAGALKRGGVETRRWAAANGPKAGRTLLAGLGAVFALFFEILGFVLNLAFAVWRAVARPVGAILGVIDRAARAVSRRLTPARALTIVVAGAAILLALSQYADYRSISIGNGAYADVQSLAPAPETGRLQAGDPHSYVFVPVAIACLLLLAVATIGGRWRACRLIAVAGFAAVVVALLVDRPAGLDPGDAAVAFEGVKAKLIGGFYAQIAAGVLLIGSSSLLARELRLAGATDRVPARSGERGEARRPRLRRRTAGGGSAGPGTEGTARA